MKALKIKQLAIITLMMAFFVSHAQEKNCGTTIDSRTVEMIKDGLIPLDRLRTSAADSYKLAITAHIIRREDGTGGLSVAQLETAIETVNSFYGAANLEFFIFGDIDFVDSDKFFDYDAGDESVLAGTRDVANTINIYFANSVTSGGSALCGYAYFPGNPDRILMDNGCTINGTTLSHEIGHYLTLYHTHGKTNNGTTDELVDGSNCTTAGDEICDTPADPNLSGKVNSSCQYTGTLRDANGDLYQPNAENIMSYSTQSCRRLFTTGQFDRSLSGYLSFRNYLISKPYNADFISEQSVVCVGDEVNFSNLSLGEYDNIEWAFTDGSPTTSTEENPNTSYTAAGSYDVQLTVYGTDGGTDIKIIEDAIKVLEYGSVNTSSMDENFESSVIGDFVLHSPSDTYTFSIESVGLESNQSLSYQFFSHTNNQNADYVLLDPIENPGAMDYVLSFDYAFTYFSDGSSERIDDIQILAKGCGQWSNVWSANGKIDATVDPKASAFNPTDQDWVHVEKYIPVEESSDFIQLAIQATGNTGNNFFIDNVAVSYATGIVIRDVAITNEMCAGDANGAIEVSASFNSNDITYSIDSENFQTNGLFPNLSGGAYQVTIKSGEETELIDATVATTSQKPAKPQIVFSDNELRLLSSAFIIEWYYNGELIDDSGTTKIPFNGNGNYQVIVRNEIGCENISDIFIILDSTSESDRMVLYPNPATDYLKVKVSKPTAIEIVDLTGRILKKQPAFKGEISMNISGLNSGVYLVRAKTETGTIERIIVVHH
ncbi:T9SS type A sorting domain-containing protein [Ekhidna sp.]|uniref:zinc-dependent metalloprotease n=1 Tax=Ekhidna sp. TaxID=2608089 RepID=UPI003299525E